MHYFCNKHSFFKYAKVNFFLTRAGLEGDHVMKVFLIKNPLDKVTDNEQARSASGPTMGHNL